MARLRGPASLVHPMKSTLIDSPVGKLLLAGTERGLVYLGFAASGDLKAPAAEHQDGAFSEAARQLKEYWSGERTEFAVPLDLRGTPFQQRVWAELQRIPCGTTITYGALARRVGKQASAARAVGSANGANPIAILVPCHRVIASTGALTGYREGLAYKRALLEHEGALTSA